VAAMLCAGCTSAPKERPVTHQATAPNDDDELITRVQEAVRAGVAPDALAERVGRKPAIDTTAGQPIEMLRRVNLIPDPDHPTEAFSLESAREVVYWVRPIEAKNPRIVGVQLDTDGKAHKFFGVVLPP
jgi:hypothetical protein